MRKIDQLKALLNSQEPEGVKSQDWDKLEPEIKPTPTALRESGVRGLELEIIEYQIAFVFDPTGEKFLGIYNWKE